MRKILSRRLQAALCLTAFTLAAFAPSAFAERTKLDLDYELPDAAEVCSPSWSNAWCMFS